MRIAQLVIAPSLRARMIETARLDDTARDTGGFGSTGTR
jgi:dUTP pyrophosphatase